MRALLRIIMTIPNRIYNYLLATSRNVSYQSFPQIIGRIVISGRGKLSFGKQVMINSDIYINPVGMTNQTMFYIGPNGVVEIGNNVGITNSLFFANEKIIIKDDVLIGGGCQLLDNDFHSTDYKDRLKGGKINVKSKPIIINESAFIGTSSIILKGVTIGARSIIAAGSVVTKSIPSDEIWGGNPAVFIKKNTTEKQPSVIHN